MKNSTLILIVAGTSFSAAAQSGAEMAPYSTPVHRSYDSRAMFTLQHDSDPKTIALGLAGAYWTGTEFWVSRWGVDSIFTADGTGASTAGFVVTGVSQVRAITSDGTFLYMVNNTNTVYKVNPATKSLVSSFTSAAATTSRYLTYDPTLNGGAGGFWTGNYATDWIAISMTGSVLSSIPAATHGLTSVYGLAYDPYTPGGPYLWAFDQNGGTFADIVQFDMTGTSTGISHDTQADLAGGNTGIAGGLFVCTNYVAGKVSIGGLNQGQSLFMYELADYTSIDEQALNTATDISMYPNPSGNNTAIRFNLPAAQHVVYDIYNAQGALVSTANLGEMGLGEHKVQINCSNLENGMYLVRLTAGGKSYTQQLSVLK